MRLSSFIKTGIFITTDKVYKNNEWEWPYRENEMLGGYDPYSASKAVAELIITSYRNSFFNNADFSKHNTAIASVRAGNVIGGGDWSNNRIIPDCIRSIESNQTIELRNPNAVRPWQHVIEPIFGYLLLGAKMQQSRLEYNEAYNFGPESANIVSVKKLVEKLIEIKKTGTWKDVSNNAALHEANYLSLDINKAKKYINWFPLLTFDETIELTMEWYENYSTKNVFDLSINQIEKYCTLWTLKNGK
jgi:CDP-glucose 4,6-dehydratase